jgi:peptide/nickel transport system substrate-binding protein
MTLAIDRRAILDTLVPAIARPSVGPIPSVLWAHAGDVERLEHDPEAARRLLHEAGWRDGDGDGILDRGGTPFRFELETNQGSDLRGKIVEMVAAQLRRVGVEASPRLYEFAAFVARHEAHDFDAFVGGWRESTKVDLRSVLHSAAARDGYNYGQYSDPELDAVIDRARDEPDRELARGLWRRAQEIVARDQPFTFLFEQDRLHAVRAGLAGFRPSARSALAGIEEWHWEGR